jgi:hypothetical protein
MIQSNVKISPARDATGRATHGVIYLWSHWNNRRWKGSDVPSWNPADLALTVAKLPKGIRNGSMFRIALQVDPGGTVDSCGVAAPIRPEMINLFCRQAAAETAPPVLDDKGSPVGSVQEFSVRLTSQKSLDRLVKRLRQR